MSVQNCLKIRDNFEHQKIQKQIILNHKNFFFQIWKGLFGAPNIHQFGETWIRTQEMTPK